MLSGETRPRGWVFIRGRRQQRHRDPEPVIGGNHLGRKEASSEQPGLSSVQSRQLLTAAQAVEGGGSLCTLQPGPQPDGSVLRGVRSSCF